MTKRPIRSCRFLVERSYGGILCKHLLMRRNCVKQIVLQRVNWICREPNARGVLIECGRDWLDSVVLNGPAPNPDHPITTGLMWPDPAGTGNNLRVRMQEAAAQRRLVGLCPPRSQDSSNSPVGHSPIQDSHHNHCASRSLRASHTSHANRRLRASLNHGDPTRPRPASG